MEQQIQRTLGKKLEAIATEQSEGPHSSKYLCSYIRVRQSISRQFCLPV
jgi:hypothetical protein